MFSRQRGYLSCYPSSLTVGPKERGTDEQTTRLVHFPVIRHVCLIETTARGKSSQQATRETGMDHGKESESQRSDIDDDCVSPKGWAAPRGSAILGQPVGPAKQASLRVPSFKN